MTCQQYRRWAALSATFILQTRAAENRDAAMTPRMLQQTVLQMVQNETLSQSAPAWLQRLSSAIQQLLKDLEAFSGDVEIQYPHEVAALASLCCELSCRHHFEQLSNRWLVHKTTCYQGQSDMQLSRALVRFDLCSNGTDPCHEFIRSVFGHVSESDLLLLEENCVIPLLVAGEDFVGQGNVGKAVAVAMRMDSSTDYLYLENAVGSVASMHQMTEWQKAEVIFRLKHVCTMYQLKHGSDDNITKSVIQLAQLVLLHKWRLQVVHYSLDVNSDHDLSLIEFNQLWTLESLCGKLAASHLMRAEAEVMLLEDEISELEKAFRAVMKPEDRAAATNEMQDKQAQLDKLEEHVASILSKTSRSGLKELEYLQFAAILNLGVAGCFGSLSTTDLNRTLECMIATFPILFAAQLACQVCSRGFHEVFVAATHPAQCLARRMSLIVVIAALFGAVLLLIDTDHTVMNGNCQRALASSSMFLIITTGSRFSRMILSLGHSIATCAPIAFFVFDIVLLFAIASKDLFGDKVMDGDTGHPYFDTYTHSLSTMFRLFLGEG